MSVRLDVSAQARAPIQRVWDVLIDWEGQSRWIPLTSVRVTSRHGRGLGVRVAALSGTWLGALPLGLLDRFVVTGWSPPGEVAELEVLHLGPCFTGPGVFRLAGHAEGTTITATELVDLPGGGPVEAVARLALPALRAGFVRSLRSLAKVAEGE